MATKRNKLKVDAKPKGDAAVSRKGGYPYYPLRQCIKLASVVKDHGGDRAGVPKSVIANGLELSQSSSGFALLVASAKTFGIVDGLSELQLAPLGRSYFFPVTDAESRQAELAFMAEPPVFRDLIKQMDGSRLPNSGIIANILSKLGVAESWRLRAAQIFASTASELNVLDGAGFLRYEAARHAAGSPPVVATSPVADIPFPGPAQTAQVFAPGSQTAQVTALDSRNGRNVWQYSEAGGTVRLETPDPLPRSLWVRLQKYITIIEPEAPAKEGPQSGST